MMKLATLLTVVATIQVSVAMYAQRVIEAVANISDFHVLRPIPFDQIDRTVGVRKLFRSMMATDGK